MALNSHYYLKNGGHCVISIKASCVDSTASPEAVFAQEVCFCMWWFWDRTITTMLAVLFVHVTARPSLVATSVDFEVPLAELFVPPRPQLREHMHALPQSNIGSNLVVC